MMRTRFLVATVTLIFSVIPLCASDNITIGGYDSDQNTTQDNKILNQLSTLEDLNSAKYGALSPSAQKQIASQFYLNPKEYAKYLRIKATSPIGQSYKGRNMGPSFYLAMDAQMHGDSAAKMKYIAKYAKLEEKLTGSLTNNSKNFQQSSQQQNSFSTPIKLKGVIPQGYTTYGVQKKSLNTVSGETSFFSQGKLTANATYVVIADTEVNNPNLARLAAKLNQFQPAPRLDIYFVGEQSDQALIEYAQNNGLEPFLQSHTVTINHEGIFVDSLDKMTQTKLHPGMLLKEDHGHYYIMNWSVING
jgi:hypothetical protein